MRHYRFPTCLSGSIRSYLHNRTISLSFDEKVKPPKQFLAGLPQGSPLSPVLSILYSSALTLGHLTSLQTEICYVDDEIISQGAQTTETARREQKSRLNERISRAIPLNITFAPKKCELMHMIPITSKLNPNTPEQSIRRKGKAIEPQKCLKSLGVIIDHRISFRIHVAKASNSAKKAMGMIAKVIKLRGVSPGAIHHLVTTTAIPALM